jgi:hypothetical protein
MAKNMKQIALTLKACFASCNLSLLPRPNHLSVGWQKLVTSEYKNEIHRTKNTQGVPLLKEDVRAGGQIAGSAKKQIERKLGRSIVSEKNFLKSKEIKKIKE